MTKDSCNHTKQRIKSYVFTGARLTCVICQLRHWEMDMKTTKKLNCTNCGKFIRFANLHKLIMMPYFCRDGDCAREYRINNQMKTGLFPNSTCKTQ